MHDEPLDWVSNWRSTAIKDVDGYIGEITGSARNRLSTSILSRYRKHCYSLGWKVSIDFPDGIRRDLHILANNDFPYAAPRIAIADHPAVLTWPHLESEGHLCIFPPEAAVSNKEPAAVVEQLLREACQLVEDSIHKRNVEDFRQEFTSYWSLSTNDRSPTYISLLEPLGPSRHISIWRGQTTRVAGEESETLQRWLDRWGAEKNKDGCYSIQDGILIWLDIPLIPEEYPDSASDMRKLAKKSSPDAEKILEEMVSSDSSIDVILGAETSNGTCFAAVCLKPPRHTGGPPKSKKILIKGFRPGHVPQKILTDMYLSETSKVVKSTVERADHLWIHGRDRDLRQKWLRRARVAILGCGSVGAPLARLLAQAGVSNLLLVDPATMDWPNISRHELGASSVNKPKASELSHELEKTYPHLEQVLWRKEKVGPAGQKLVNELSSYDLVISTMGNWAAESFLNDIQQDIGNFPPILYGWVEPNVAAAHALLLRGDKSCLRCGMDDTGRPLLEVASWPNDEHHLQEPACGAIFTPYGPAELCWAHALLSEAAINALTNPAKIEFHRIWIGHYQQIEAAGGSWAPDWIKEVGDPNSGGMTIERQWPASASCPTCSHCRNLRD